MRFEYREPTPALPPKDAPPGYAISFDRRRRYWLWREYGSDRVAKPFSNRTDALTSAYADYRNVNARRLARARTLLVRVLDQYAARTV